MNAATLTYDNIVWEVTYEWEDAQIETDIDPPIPAIATIDQIYVNGIELYEHIDVHTIYALEAMIVESHEWKTLPPLFCSPPWLGSPL